ncbi:DUF3048 domain-containing protein [Actinopolymorpha alba]|uniref:DUF3048 domain-containing protein n=1 Tax=Actinopolymorpha alba TaxID=533267 RepID=UPI000380CAD8|nr:DUF3048 domain-containing protein [Actinopolymorpha alba]
MSAPHKNRPFAAFAAVVLLATVGCSSLEPRDEPAAPGASPTVTTSTTPSSTPSSTVSATAPSPSLPASIQPLSGLPGSARKPVLAVKIDNVAAARPQTGLSKADLIYVEPVEAGLARIMAVFSSRLPSTVGPVRSARESDLELLRQYGTPAFAYSGANGKVLPLIAKAPVEDVSPAHAGSPYFRGTAKPAPHNLYVRPADLLARAPKASKAHDIGFRFGPAPAGGRADMSETVRYSAFKVGITWSASKGRWTVSMDGKPFGAADGTPARPSTVVVQYVDISPSRFGDKWGNNSPYTKSVGSGRARVLRDGRSYDAHWSRPSATSGTSFTTASGQPMTFAPGQVWVVFAPRS